MLVNWENTRVLCPSSKTSRSCGRSTSSLALDSPDRLALSIKPGGHAACRRRSSASRIWIFAFLIPSRATPPEQRVPVVLAQLVVELALGGLQVAVDRLFG